MSSRSTTGKDFGPPKSEIRSVTFTERGGEVIVRLRNDNDRAVHYIADVRAMLFDPATRRLTIRLSDAGRTRVAGIASIEPDFRYIDPHSDAELKLLLPPTMVKLAATAGPGDEVRFEEHAPANATEIVVEIGWADTPYYEDPRGQATDAYPTALWEQGRVVASSKLRPNTEPAPQR